MKIAIIEDESLASSYLKNLLQQQNILIIEHIVVLRSVKESIAYLKDHTVDLLFMDIHLGDGKSLEIFETIQVTSPIIFVTAYDSYAIQVFKQFTIDYILKPFSGYELKNALEKFKTIHKQFESKNSLEALSELDKEEKQTTTNRFLVVSGHKLKPLLTSQIAYFFAEGKHLFITTFDNNTYIYNDTLKGIIAKVDNKEFFKINRNYIINIQAIAEIIKHNSQKIEIILLPKKDKDQGILVSKNLITELKAWLG